MTRGRRGAALLGFVGVAVVVACGDPYLHTNPYDPVVPVAIDITGPDTLFSVGEIGQYSVRTTPSFPDTAIQWAIDSNAHVPIAAPGDSVVNGSTYLATGGAGQFQSLNPPLEPASVLVTVYALIGRIDTTLQYAIPGTPAYQYVQAQTVKWSVYRHIGLKVVALTQRVTQIQLRCPDTHACDTVSAGGTWSVWVDGFDTLGREITSLKDPTANPAAGPPVATYVVRDSTIAHASPVGIRATTVTALKSGTTWVVATRGALLDSLRVVVR